MDINCLLVQWHSLSREEQAKYYEKARQERQLHMQLYPGWSARDNYGYGTKKKKRKKERTPVEAGGTKIARTLNHTWEVWTWHRAHCRNGGKSTLSFVLRIFTHLLAPELTTRVLTSFVFLAGFFEGICRFFCVRRFSTAESLKIQSNLFLTKYKNSRKKFVK